MKIREILKGLRYGQNVSFQILTSFFIISQLITVSIYHRAMPYECLDASEFPKQRNQSELLQSMQKAKQGYLHTKKCQLDRQLTSQ